MQSRVEIQNRSRELGKRWPKGQRRVIDGATAKAWMKQHRHFIDKNGLLYKVTSLQEELLCIPDIKNKDGRRIRTVLVEKIHNNLTSIHLGRDRLRHELQRRMYWPNMVQDITQVLRECVPCQRNKVSRQVPQGLLQQLEVPVRPGTHYSMDLITHLPKSGSNEYTAVFTIVDRFSKRIWLIPTHDTCSAPMLAELFVKHIVMENGIPLEIVSDRDTRFASEHGFWKNFYKALGTSIQLSTARHQRTDGQTERAIAYATECLRMGISYKQDNWSSLLPQVQFSINSSVAAATGMSPLYIEKGRHPVMKLDSLNIINRGGVKHVAAEEFIARIHTIDQEVYDRMLLTKQYAEKHFNRKVREQAKQLVPGSYTWLKSEGLTMPWDKSRKVNKLRAKYYGPFKILEQISPVTFRLQLPDRSRIHPVFHVALLKPAYGHNVHQIPVEQFPEEDDDTEYVVEGILAHRERHGETQYLVKWKGYMYEEATWEPEINLGNSMEKLEEYKNRAEKFSRHDTVDTLEKQVQTVKGTP
jgi:hypothetical protein